MNAKEKTIGNSAVVPGLALAAVLVIAGMRAEAFSLLGPYAAWMQPNIGYQLPGDIGGPMDFDEGYRWNVPVVTYGFDQTFLDYFGSNGVAAVEGAIQILNDLPSASSILLTNYPLETSHVNYTAAANGLWDLKSSALALLIEQMGLAQPSRWVFTLHVFDTNFFWYYPDQESWGAWAIPTYILERNFDPETLVPSQWVNNELLSGWIWFDGTQAQVVPIPMSLASGYAPALADAASSYPSYAWIAGQYFTGLTRDDVGGLGYLLSAENVNYESLLRDVTEFDTISTNFVNGAWRPGVEKVTFSRQFSTGSPGQFAPLTLSFTGTYLTNGVLRRQHLIRPVTQPDILFCAGDPGAGRTWTPYTIRTGTDQWINNALLNWDDPTKAGPGVIQPPITITFHKLGLRFWSEDWYPPAEVENSAWGSFDGSTNNPIAYPAADSVLPASLTLRLRLSNNHVPTGAYIWQLPVPVGGVALLQASTNLLDWVSFGAVTNAGAMIEWDHSATNYVQRFFRAVPQ